MQWARDIPYAMVTLLVYETLQKAAARRKGPPGSEDKQAKANPFENMVIGAIAGGMGSLVTNPMDMVKTRMMTSPELYAGPMDAAWKALSKEGPQVQGHAAAVCIFPLKVAVNFIWLPLFLVLTLSGIGYSCLLPESCLVRGFMRKVGVVFCFPFRWTPRPLVRRRSLAHS